MGSIHKRWIDYDETGRVDRCYKKKKGERERLIERRLIDQTIVNQRILMGETKGRAEEKRHSIIAE